MKVLLAILAFIVVFEWSFVFFWKVLVEDK
jgi:hypothetical protein